LPAPTPTLYFCEDIEGAFPPACQYRYTPTPILPTSTPTPGPSLTPSPSPTLYFCEDIEGAFPPACQYRYTPTPTP
jgi:hypothetical protein